MGIIGLYFSIFYVERNSFIDLVRWLFNFLCTALRQCDKTADWWERLVYLKKALVAILRLYKELMDYHSSKDRKG